MKAHPVYLQRLNPLLTSLSHLSYLPGFPPGFKVPSVCGDQRDLEW